MDVCYVVALLYLCAVALEPSLITHAPKWFQWFGYPDTVAGSVTTIAVVLALPLIHFGLRHQAGRYPLSGPPLVVIAAMAASAVLLGMSSYWRCEGDSAPFFGPLSWTLALFVGNVEPAFGPDAAEPCKSMPVALEIARLLAISTTLTAASAAAMALFRSQLDRIAIWRARMLTLVVGIDDETVSMVRAIARSKNPAATLVVLTDDRESGAARAVHDLGARVRTVNFAEPQAMSLLPLWDRLDRLYLLSADPMENLKLFNVIDAEVTRARRTRGRMPLTVRIDDPWQAEVWRRSFLINTDRCWVADAVGRYEVTAAKLVRHLTTRPADDPDLEPPTTVVLCGLYPLTYALASEFAQLQRDQQLYAKPRVIRPSNVIIFARGAQSFVDDHQLRQGRMAPDGTMLPVVAHDGEPAVDEIADYFAKHDPASHAVVLSDPSMETLGTRLASRFPNLRVYAASGSSTSLVDTSIVGHLYSFPINMELEDGAPQDVWERAAELIHEHFSAGRNRDNPTTRPWKDLDPFIRQSNRRQLLNALWMVETLAGHTWNSLEQCEPTEPLPENLTTLDPLEQLKILGFDQDTALRMAETEHEDWRRYYQAAKWTYNEHRDDGRRRHNKLLPWEELVERHPEFVPDACRSLASTLINLRNLGYRSVPKTSPEAPERPWRPYRRRGEVEAEKRARGWTWTTSNGDVMRAQPGDWAVTDAKGNERSVADDVFESTHERVGPRRYRRSGTVLARQATRQEVIPTLEGDVVANEGDWIVQGRQGEQWPVPDEHFRTSYEGPVAGESG